MDKGEQTIHDIGNAVKLSNPEIFVTEAIPLGIIKRKDFEAAFNEEWVYEIQSNTDIITENKRDEIWKLYKKYNKKDNSSESPVTKYIDEVEIFIRDKKEFYNSWSKLAYSGNEKFGLNSSFVRIAWRYYRKQMRYYTKKVANSKFEWWYLDSDTAQKKKFDPETNAKIELMYINVISIQKQNMTCGLYLGDDRFTFDFLNMDIIVGEAGISCDIYRERKNVIS